METPDTEDKPRPKMPPAPKTESGYYINEDNNLNLNLHKFVIFSKSGSVFATFLVFLSLT